MCSVIQESLTPFQLGHCFLETVVENLQWVPSASSSSLPPEGTPWRRPHHTGLGQGCCAGGNLAGMGRRGKKERHESKGQSKELERREEEEKKSRIGGVALKGRQKRDIN